MERCDVLIVGGGPSGSACASRLRQAGLDVVILDKQTFPRDKVCAGWLTPAVLDCLGIDPNEYAKAHVLQPITGFRVSQLGRDPVEVEYGRTVSYGIRRIEFDRYLLERSEARLRLGESLAGMERSAKGWVVNGNLQASLVVGAGGHFCPVARRFRAEPSEQVVAAQEVEFRLTPGERRECRIEESVPELYFCEDLKGYAWCFRKGDYLNVGLGREDPHAISGHVASFLEYLKRSGRVGFDIASRFHGHAYLLYGRGRRRLVDEGVLLIGDAAGLAYAQSGEGIRPAVESGLLAAETVIAARGDYSEGALAPYERRLRERFGESSGPQSPSWLPESVKREVAGRLLGTRWFARHLVLDRWFLHAHQAALA